MNKVKQKKLKSSILNPKSLIKSVKFRTWISLGVLTILVPLTVVYMFSAKQAEAGWFDDLWAYRIKIPVTNNTSAESAKYIAFDGTAGHANLDTSASGRFQSDCGDIRFTKEDGEILPYIVNSGCTTSSTDIDVYFDSFPAGTTNIYMYYGNSSATDGFSVSSFSSEASDYTIGSLGSEEKGEVPIAYWKFDEGTDNTCSGGSSDGCDSSNNGNSAAFGSTTAAPTWKNESMCFEGKCIYLDGTNDFASVSNTISNIQTVSFYIKILSNTTTEEIMDINGTDYFSSVSGELTVNGFGTATVYIDGLPGTTLTPAVWHNVTITTTSGFSGSGIKIGQISTNYGNFYIDNIKLYNYERSQAQVKTDIARVSAASGVGASFGGQNQAYLNNGLVGYWNLDETTGDASDSSGYGTTLTNNDTTVYSGAKFGYGAEPDGAADYLSVTDNATLSITGNLTLSAWIQPDDTTGQQDIVGKWDGTNNSYLLALSGNELVMYVDSAGSYETTTSTNIPANVFTHVVGVYEANAQKVSLYVNGVLQASTTTGVIPVSIGDDAGAFAIGADSSPTDYFDGHIDDVRLYNRILTGKEVQNLYNWAPGPVGYWNFDQKTGTTYTYDRSGNGQSGTIGGSMTESDWVPGRYGSALDFDGGGAADDVITVSDAAPIRNIWDGGGTAEAWIYPRSDGEGNDGHFLDKESWYLSTELESGGFATLKFKESFDGSSWGYWRSASKLIALNTWNHIALTYSSDSTGDNVKMYINGASIPVSYDIVADGVRITDSAHAFTIGNYTSGIRTFDGDIDEVRLYNYARTPGQIIEDMNGGHPVGGSPIGSQVGYWGFDYLSGSTAYNKNPNFQSLTGAITEAAWTSNTTCKIDNCLSFDGSNDVVTVTNANAIDFDTGLHDAFTFSAWINPDTVGEGSAGQIFVKNTSTYCQLGGSAPFNLTCSVNEATDATLTINSIIPAGSWTHIALSWSDDADDQLTIWVNGRKMGSSTDGVGPLDTDATDLLIGGGTSNNFDGYIDEFKVYSSELTAEQIQIDRNANSAVNIGVGTTINTGIPGFGTGPVGYWDFDEGIEGAIVPDRSGHNYNSSTIVRALGAGHLGKGLRGIIDDGGLVNRVDIPTNTDIDFTNTEDFTLSVWARVLDGEASPNKDIYLFDKGAGSGAADGYILRMRNNELRCRYSDAGTTSPVSEDAAVSSTNYIDGRWHHYMCIMDRTGAATGTAGLHLFVDGVLAGSDTTLTQGDGSSTQDLWLGERTSGVEFNGVEDEAKVWDRALTLPEIQYEYLGGKPTAHWKFDECQGVTANDSGGYSVNSGGSVYTGTINAGSNDNTTVGTCGSGTTTEMWNDGTTGKRNGSLGFDGNDDYVQVTDAANIRFDSTLRDFSIFSWVKRSGTGEANIISKEDAADDGWRMQFTSSDTVRCSVNAIDIDSTSTITDTNWHFVGCSIDRSGNGQVYIDGKADGTPTAISSEVMATTSNITIGTQSYTPANYFQGQIDDLRIYPYPLTQTQVKRIMNNDAAVFFGPLTGSP